MANCLKCHNICLHSFHFCDKCRWQLLNDGKCTECGHMEEPAREITHGMCIECERKFCNWCGKLPHQARHVICETCRSHGIINCDWCGKPYDIHIVSCFGRCCSVNCMNKLQDEQDKEDDDNPDTDNILKTVYNLSVY